jgi:peptidyl-prolyl cis-trans isomerase SurA
MPALLRLLGAAVLSALLVAGCSSSQPASSTGPSSAPPAGVVLARYADSSITADQFERRYRRTIGHPDTLDPDAATAYDDFLQRYLDFRLKVQAARDAGFDTLASLRTEAASYRKQMARPTLLRREVIEPVVRQIYDRRQTEIRVRHLLVRVPEDAAPSDTLSAYRRIQTLADSLDQGVSFGDLARRQSDDPSAQQEGRRGYRGDLGYLTAGQIVAPFEDAMYATPVDSTSDILRTRFGYHILRVEDRRPRAGRVDLSHLLIRPDSASAQDSLSARRKADSLRQALRRGASFADLARTHSDDRRSAQRGGDLGTVQPSGSLPPPLREAARSLPIDSVSRVLETRYGYHLLKVTGREQRPSFAEAYDDLKQQVSRLPRLEKREAELARDIRRQSGVRVDTASLRQAAGGTLDTTGRALLPVPSGANAAVAVAFLGESSFTVRDLARHVARTDGAASRPLRAVLEGFLNARAIDRAAARLERRDPAFAAQMREYRDGLLLFEYMQDSVWTVAAQDTALLREVYRRHADRYRFPERVRVLALRAAADSLLAPYASTYEDGAPRADVAARAASDSLVRLDTTFVTASSSAPYTEMQSAADGAAHGPVRDGGDWLYLIRDTRLPPRPKSFAEARSEVVRTAQDAYEADVVRALRERYDARTYPERLRHVFTDTLTAGPSQP